MAPSVVVGRNTGAGARVFAGMKPKISTTLVLALATLAVPATANAAVTVQADPTNLTLTSDAASDNITLGVAGGNITHNLPASAGTFADNQDFDPGAGVLNLPSNGTVNLTINAGDGNDNVNVSAPTFAGNPVINGGGGDDIILGSPQVDQIDGGDGNDRITAFRGSEPAILGGNGNDVIIWNNGDGNDVNVGGAGIDETLITQGNADDVSAITQVGATVHFERTNAPFTVDSNEMEKLTLTSFAGNDTLTTGPGVAIPMTVDAGPGDDNIATGAGTDRIVGDRGNDTLNGGEGDDTLVWNNGDGSDVMEGAGGIDRIENNLGAADDVSTLKIENGRVRYDRVNAPFSLSVGTAEVFELNTFGGNDTLTTVPNLPITLDADMGAGNDDFNVRDGVQSIVQGGSGTDKVTADTVDLIAADVETVDRPAVPGAGTLVLPKSAKVKRNVATLKVSCPADTTGCEGKITLLSKKLRFGPFRGQLVLGTKKFKVDAGERANVRVKLVRGASRLAKRKRLTVTARVVSNGMSDKNRRLTLKF